MDYASIILNLDLADLLYNEQQTKKLVKTQYAQPVILTISYALYQLLNENISFKKFGVGLSLGEYSALSSADYIDFSTALLLIKKRGELMQKASENSAGSMVAVKKKSFNEIQAVLYDIRKLGKIGIANVNTPYQIVLGGESNVINIFSKRITNEGGVVIPLNVSGAFHTPLMQTIQADLNKELNQVNWQLGKFPVYSTTTQAQFLPSNIINILTTQLVSTTYFSKTLDEHSNKLTAVIEVGPGKTLISFAHKILKGILTYRTDSMAELQKTITAIEAMN